MTKTIQIILRNAIVVEAHSGTRQEALQRMEKLQTLHRTDVSSQFVGAMVPMHVGEYNCHYKWSVQNVGVEL